MTFDAGKKIGRIANDVKHASADYVTNSRVYVKENPIKGVAMAATAGVVLGGLLTKSGEDHSSLNQNIREAIKEVSFKIILGFISAITILVALIYLGNYLLYWLE